MDAEAAPFNRYQQPTDLAGKRRGLPERVQRQRQRNHLPLQIAGADAPYGQQASFAGCP